VVPIEIAAQESNHNHHNSSTTPPPPSNGTSSSDQNATVECSAKKRKASPFVDSSPSSSAVAAATDLELAAAAQQQAAENSLSFVTPNKLARVAAAVPTAHQTLPSTSLQHLVSTRVAPSLGNAPGAAANHVANINSAILAQLQAQQQSALGGRPAQQLGTPTVVQANQQPPPQLTVQGSFAIAQTTQSHQLSLINAAAGQTAALQAANRQAVLLAGKQEESSAAAAAAAAAAQVLKLPEAAGAAVVASGGGHQIINSAGKPTAMSIQQKDTTYTKIFVGGLPYHTTDASLRDYFAVFGEIDEAVVITDRQTGKSRGYGFVTMSDKSAAERACKDPNPVIDGRKANVNLAYIGAKPRVMQATVGLRSIPQAYSYTNQYGTLPAVYAQYPQPAATAYVAHNGMLIPAQSAQAQTPLIDYTGAYVAQLAGGAFAATDVAAAAGTASYGGAFTAAQLQQAQALAAASAAHPQLIAAAPAQAGLTASHAGLTTIPGLQTMPAYTTMPGGGVAAAVAAAAANPYQAAAAAQQQNPYAGATLQQAADTRFA